MLVKDSGYNVKYPSDREGAYKPNDACDKKHRILLKSALDDTVDGPHDIESWNTEDDLDNPRKVVNKLNEIFHCVSPFVNCGCPQSYFIIPFGYFQYGL